MKNVNNMPRKKKETAEEEIKKPKAIGPFDIIKMMFTDKQSFDSLSDLALARNFFMINRIMAIQFPLQAQCFNQLNINQALVIRSWQTFATTKLGYGKVPSFVYTKGAKAMQEAVKDEFSKELKEAYCKKYEISLKDFDEMLYFNHDNMINHVKNFDKLNSTVEQNKLITKTK